MKNVGKKEVDYLIEFVFTLSYIVYYLFYISARARARARVCVCVCVCVEFQIASNFIESNQWLSFSW